MKKYICKNILALVMIVAMLLPCLPVVAFAANDTVEDVTYAKRCEDLTVAQAYTKLKTLKDTDGVYVLTTVEHLAWFMACGRGTGAKSFDGATIRLGADIEWNKGTVENGIFKPAEGEKTVYLWETYSTIPSTGSNYFKGTFDGNGKTVTGLYISQCSGTVGFIGVASEGAKIQNVTFSNAYVENTAVGFQNIKTVEPVGQTYGASAGVVVGTYGGATAGTTLSNVKLDNCYVKSSCVGDSVGGVGAFCGAPIWKNGILTMENCVADHNTAVVGYTNVGGFVGSDLVDGGNVTVNINNCISYATIMSETDNASAFVGKSLYTVNIKESTFFGALAVGDFSTNGKIYQNGATAANLEMDDADNGVVAIEGVQCRKNANDGTKFDVRFMASLDFDAIDPALGKEDFRTVGFEVAELNQFAANAENAVQNAVVKTVYTSIQSTFGSIEILGLREDQSEVKYVIDADYLATLTIEDIPTSGIKTVVARPYYVSRDSDARIYGAYVVVTLANGAVVASTEIASAQNNKRITLACSFDAETYDMTKLFPDDATVTVKKNGVTKADSTAVALTTGVNDFEVSVVKDGVEFFYNVSIAKRDKHRVVLNTNGGSFIETQYVQAGGTIDINAFVPTRNRYTFIGWYDQEGNEVTGNVSITKDTTFIAHWSGPNTFETPSAIPVEYTTSSAALNIVWKDYADAFGVRPTEVYCTLKDLKNNTEYEVKVTKTSAEFIGAAPAGASISQGAGNWTVKITGLAADSSYGFVMDELGGADYTTVQSGTSVYNTLKDYNPLWDDSSNLMTMNGRFYDLAGNVIVLKGMVPRNVNDSNFAANTSTATLKRIQEEGCNVIRITMPLGDSAGYRTEGKKQIYVPRMQGAIDRASALGMYVIVDWGVMMKNGADKLETDENGNKINAYLVDWLPDAKEFFGNMSAANKGNPYVIYELANEPTVSSNTNAWEGYLKPWYEALINCIRTNDANAMILAAPNMHARRLSANIDNQNAHGGQGDDPIDKPFATELSYNVGFTFHCYAYTTLYRPNTDQDKTKTSCGWRVCDAIKNGLPVVITEFSPADASMSIEGGSAATDFLEMDKWVNFILENDVNYTMFRYGPPPTSENAVLSQCLFAPGDSKDAIYNGTWTYDMLSDSGKYFYDNLMNSTGFIKKAQFTS